MGLSVREKFSNAWRQVVWNMCEHESRTVWRGLGWWPSWRWGGWASGIMQIGQSTMSCRNACLCILSHATSSRKEPIFLSSCWNTFRLAVTAELISEKKSSILVLYEFNNRWQISANFSSKNIFLSLGSLGGTIFLRFLYHFLTIYPRHAAWILVAHFTLNRRAPSWITLVWYWIFLHIGQVFLPANLSKAFRHALWNTWEHESNTCGWRANSSLQMAQGCTESPCSMDRCFTCSHSSVVSGMEGGSTKPNLWANVKGGGQGSRTYSFSGSSCFLWQLLGFLNPVSTTALILSLFTGLFFLLQFFDFKGSANERFWSWRLCKMWSCNATAVSATDSRLEELPL